MVDGAHTADEGIMPLEIHVSSTLCVVVAFGIEGCCFGVRRGIFAATAPRGRGDEVGEARGFRCVNRLD